MSCFSYGLAFYIWGLISPEVGYRGFDFFLGLRRDPDLTKRGSLISLICVNCLEMVTIICLNYPGHITHIEGI